MPLLDLPLQFGLPLPGLALLGLSSVLANLGLLVFAARRLPDTPVVRAMLLFILCSTTWQLYDLVARTAIDAATAQFWSSLLRPLVAATPAALLWFVLTLRQQAPLRRWPVLLPLTYGPVLLLAAGFQVGLIPSTMHWVDGLGWVADSSKLGHLSQFLDALLGLETLVATVLLGLHAYQRRDAPDGFASRLMAVGIAVPSVLGVLTEVGLPLLGHRQFPVTGLTLVLFTLSMVVAFTRYGLFDIATPATARAIVDALRDELLLIDARGEVLWANARARHAWEHEGRLSGRFADPDDASAFLQDLENPQRQAAEREVVWKRGGHPTPYVLSVGAVPLAGRRSKGFVVLAHDLSLLKSTERALRDARDEAIEANRSKSHFLANMSHELRTPLNAILGYTELLREEILDPDQLQDLTRIHGAGRHLLGLISDLLDLGKVEAGKLDVVRQTVDLRALVGELSTEVVPLVQRQGNTLETDLPAGSVEAHADPLRVRQVLLNLVSNAAKFTTSGTITIHIAAPKDGTVHIRVIDTGLGMDADQLSLLFQPYQQVHDPSLRGRVGGTGLGLALSRELCRVMDGDLLVESEPGRGSIFTAVLPCPPGAP